MLFSVASLWYGQSGLYRRREVEAPVRFGFLKASLLTTALIVGLTEALSITSALNETHLSWIWLAIALCSLIWAISQRVPLRSFSFLRWSALSRLERFWLVAASTVLGLTLLTALLYPPNNNDSLTYHMGRIGHWMQQQSVRPFATHIERQLYQPPLAEWIILHTVALSGSDLFANTIQWVAGAGCCITLSLLTRMLGGNRPQQLATVFAAATIPMVVLQTSSTQNDVVVSYYLIALAVCLLRYYQKRHIADLIWAGLALGFAYLTKGTAYLFAAPLLAAWAIGELVRLPRRGWLIAMISLAGGSLLVVGLALAINAGHYFRNISVYGYPLTDPKEQIHYTNEVHSFGMMVSAISRNLAIHFGFPGLHWLAQHGVEQLHKWMNISVTDSSTTFAGTKFNLPMLSNNEDNASNLVHLLWFGSTVSWLFWPKKQIIQQPYKVLSVVVICMFLLFCAYLKWQPWHSRLHSPLFLLACPVLAYYLVGTTQWWATWLTRIVFASALCFALTNPFRPLITLPPLTQPVSFLNGRNENYYVNRPQLRPFYQSIVSFVKQQKRDSLQIGLVLGEDDWDYVWFQEFKPPIRLYHVNVVTASRIFSQPHPVDYIISTQTFHDTLVYNRQVYQRVSLTSARTPFLMPTLFALKLASEKDSINKPVF